MIESNTSVDDFRPGGNVAIPHSAASGKLVPVFFTRANNTGPAAAINSSIADMSKWMIVQLGRGKLPDGDKRLFSERQSREMWSPQTMCCAQAYVVPLISEAGTTAPSSHGWPAATAGSIARAMASAPAALTPPAPCSNCGGMPFGTRGTAMAEYCRSALTVFGVIGGDWSSSKTNGRVGSGAVVLRPVAS